MNFKDFECRKMHEVVKSKRDKSIASKLIDLNLKWHNINMLLVLPAFVLMIVFAAFAAVHLTNNWIVLFGCFVLFSGAFVTYVHKLQKWASRKHRSEQDEFLNSVVTIKQEDTPILQHFNSQFKHHKIPIIINENAKTCNIRQIFQMNRKIRKLKDIVEDE